MSGSPHRPPGPRRRKRRAGPDRPTRRGFTRIPEEAGPAVLACLEEAGLGAVHDLCAGLRFELAEIVRMEATGLDWLLNGEVVQIPTHTSERLRALQARLHEQATEKGRMPAELLGDELKKVTTQVRGRLAPTHRWARNIVINARSLHQLADEQAHDRYRDEAPRLRTYRRTPNARAETVRPATTAMVADSFDRAMTPLLEEVWSRCTPRARDAIERLKERGR